MDTKSGIHAIRCLALVLGLSLSFAGLALATDRYVWQGSPSEGAPYDTWNNAAHDIATAASAAARGETVWVTNGTYILGGTVTVPEGATVRSVNGNDGNTIVNGNGAYRCFDVGLDGILDGLVITNGNGVGGSGGVSAGWHTIVRNCLIVNCNGGGGNAGGIYSFYGTISNCTIRNCTATYRSGIYAWHANIVDSTICYNTSSGGVGGGIGIEAGQSTAISGCAIYGNTSVGQGGGIFMYPGDIVKDCTIYGNVATNGNGEGGGIYMYGGGFITNSTIYDNFATSHGGGVYANSGGTNVNCVISNNTSLACGGGVFFDSNLNNCDFENLTVVRNYARTSGGGVWRTDGTFTNFIVIHNDAPASPNQNNSSVFYYSCAPELAAGSQGNITSAPLFESLGSGYGTNAVAGNYRPLASSPTVNKGLTASWMIAAVDLDLKPRIANDIVDMGAYETVIPSGTTIVIR